MLVFSKPFFFDFLNCRNLEIDLFTFTRTISTFQIIGYSLMCLYVIFSCSSWFTGYLRLHLRVFKALFFDMRADYCAVGLLPVHVGHFPIALHTLNHLHFSFSQNTIVLPGSSFFIKVSNQHSTTNFKRLQSWFLIPFSLIHIYHPLNIGCCYSISFFHLTFPLFVVRWWCVLFIGIVFYQDIYC